MSTRPGAARPAAGRRDARPKVTINDLVGKKASGTPIVMVTAYDFPSAKVAESAGVDIVLVGDSGAMTVLGHESTVGVTIEEMLMLTAAVRRGLGAPLLVGDLPFGSYEFSDDQAVASARRFVEEAGCDAVKLEGGGNSVDRAKAIVRAGIPVMGHVGLTPQSAAELGGYVSQGRTAQRALEILQDAVALQDGGCFSIVFEAIPSDVAAEIMRRLTIPVIGIGAGDSVDGQVLVFHDLLGISDGRLARFVKQYGSIRAAMVRGVSDYADEVRTGVYPAPSHGYGIGAEELVRFREMLSVRL